METSKKRYNKPKVVNKNTNPNNKSSHSSMALPVKLYFPGITLDSIKEVIDQNNKISKKVNISKYLVDESNKLIIYGFSGIFEVVNNNLYQLYPIDKNIKELVINDNLKVLMDSSYMKKNETPSYQIPYHYTVKNKTIRVYKNDLNSRVKFVIEFENENVYDFYVVVTSSDINYNERKEVEINKFVKDEIMSFLLTLNLYR